MLLLRQGHLGVSWLTSRVEAVSPAQQDQLLRGNTVQDQPIMRIALAWQPGLTYGNCLTVIINNPKRKKPN